MEQQRKSRPRRGEDGLAYEQAGLEESRNIQIATLTAQVKNGWTGVCVLGEGGRIKGICRSSAMGLLKL